MKHGRAVLGAVASVALLAGCGASSQVDHHLSASARSNYAQGRTSVPVPTAQEQAATLAATKAFRREIDTASLQFSHDCTDMVGAIEAGNVAAAKADELAAQGQFDVFRPVLEGGSVGSAAIDGLPGSFAPGSTPSGLHVVEADLWGGRVAAAAVAARALEQAGPFVAFSLYRSIFTPAQIAGDEVDALGWMVDDVVDTTQEPASHADLVDVDAVLGALASATSGLAPLARIVNPRALANLETSLAALRQSVAGLPAATPDGAVAPGRWRSIAQDADVAEGAMADLEGSFWGFGTGRNYA